MLEMDGRISATRATRTTGSRRRLRFDCWVDSSCRRRTAPRRPDPVAQLSGVALLFIITLAVVAVLANAGEVTNRRRAFFGRTAVAPLVARDSTAAARWAPAFFGTETTAGGGGGASATSIPRGGAVVTDEDEEESSSLTSAFSTRLQDAVRSLLRVADSISPTLAGALESALRAVEGILGVRLLPPKKKKKKEIRIKSSQKRRKKAGSDSTPEPASKSAVTKSKKSIKGATFAASSKKTKASGATNVHVTKDLKTTSPNYRIQRELKAFVKDPPPNLTVKVGKNIRVWVVTMKGAANTIYEGETFKLRVSFPPSYPSVPPSVYFLPPNIPLHEHVYTNGDICLSLLGKDWRPTMTAQSIAVSILSILSSAHSKSLPMDNARHAQNKPGQYQQDWVYHDDNVCRNSVFEHVAWSWRRRIAYLIYSFFNFAFPLFSLPTTPVLSLSSIFMLYFI